jgi:hypothetical protein
MIRIASRPASKPAPWHEGFLKMLPTIQTCARLAFRSLKPELRAERTQEVVCNALCAYFRLYQLGKVDLAYPTVLARYGVAQVKEGRRVGGHLNIQDVSSEYCQQQKSIVINRLDHFDDEENAWQEAVIQDTRAAPVPDIVSFRIDFAEWLALLPRRYRRIAQTLAAGNTTGEVARRFDVSDGRISQLRRKLESAWQAFQGEVSAQVQPAALA